LHLRARAMLLGGVDGAGGAPEAAVDGGRERKEAVTGDELAPGPEFLGVSSSGVICGEGKVGVWFPGSNNDGWSGRVAMVSSSGSKGAEASGEETKGNSALTWQLRRG
jgi:hypothetical protein